MESVHFSKSIGKAKRLTAIADGSMLDRNSRSEGGLAPKRNSKFGAVVKVGVCAGVSGVTLDVYSVRTSMSAAAINRVIVAINPSQLHRASSVCCLRQCVEDRRSVGVDFHCSHAEMVFHALQLGKVDSGVILTLMDGTLPELKFLPESMRSELLQMKNALGSNIVTSVVLGDCVVVKGGENVADFSTIKQTGDRLVCSCTRWASRRYAPCVHRNLLLWGACCDAGIRAKLWKDTMLPQPVVEEGEGDGEDGAVEDALGEEYEDAEIECELVSGELLLMYFNNRK